MKNFIFCLLLTTAFISCKKEREEDRLFLKEPIEVTICGKIEGSFWEEVKLEIVDVYSENYKVYSFKPDSSEYFQFKFHSPWPSSFTLSVGGNHFDGWFFPGDSVYVLGERQRFNEDFIEALHFSGSGSEKYRYFQNYALNSENEVIEEKLLAAQKEPYLKFRDILDTVYNLKIEKFKNDTANLNLDSEFADYELNRIKYISLSDKIREPMLRLHLRHDSTEVPKNYFSFLKQVNFSDSSFRNSIYYYRFLKDAFSEMSKEEMPVYPIIDRWDAFVRNYFQVSDSLLQGKVKEYFETKIIHTYARLDIQRFDSMIAVLENKGYKNFLLEKHKVLNDSLQRIRLSINDSIQVFTKDRKPQPLRKQLRNTDYTYLSVWNVGCKGCHLDFKNKAEVFDRYKDKIQFINICTDEPSDVVEKFIHKYGSTGHHFYDLDGDIVNHLNVRLYPRTFLFDKEGNLLELNFYRPGDPKLEEYFDKLLSGSENI
ncbi:TlpA family protein disulfide reductase [Nafulsella turpanensis]|uniref:TlpA family protein disulfide reductase n=1 Tax=Nafulsella turpanensis TaxID=1265690 RepID=UPI00034DB4C8|nr:redoxin domain-containing protein [Nafulsella turpanensis]